ncbi:uncharacterized protein Gasu_35190 [Galdieria sulphuraria]|uniref:Uncharacterized protein n=1 Tax=Galdieria sulphuraria TaxID=130081 RepID=M2WYJ3_GALSU|nr:uncharacterized protein Gasu_35190 [Galdieria sulphuraria]EME29130.1 hypothetical protein Gasu_35190 [Galdieria sulphuraria]|eukprot:XP_005705650.1 hypothetical protein Gasu_35190 [Galdieria sulphuraria]
MSVSTIPDRSQSGFRFKENWSLYVDKLFQNVEDDSASLSRLSVCNETEVLAIVKGSQVVVTWLKSIQQSTNELTEYKRLKFSKVVKNFGFAKKGNILFVHLQQEVKLTLYSIAALFQNNTEPVQVISVSSVPCKIWTVEEEEHLYCSDYSQIERIHWPSSKHQILFRLPQQVQELMFSPEGRRVASITKDAKFQLWDDKGKELDQRILPLELPLPTLELFWNHPTILLIMVHRMDGMLLICCSIDAETHIQQVNIYSSPFIEAPCSMSNGMSPFGMIQVIEEWQLFILGVSYSTDIQVIYKEKEQIYLLMLEEGEEISCPVDEHGGDTYPVAFALDWTNTMPVPSKISSDTKLCAMPRLVLLLNNDMLKYYSVINDHCTQPCTRIRPSIAPIVVGLSSSQKEKSLSESPSESQLSSHQRNSFTTVDMDSMCDNLTKKMQRLFHEITKKQDNLDVSLPQEIMDRRMLRIDARYQDCKVQCRKLLQQCDRLHKEWIEQIIGELEECEKMRLEEEQILYNAENQSETFLQDWIHPQWKEIEQQVQEKKRQIEHSIDFIQEFLEKTYRDRKAAHHIGDTSVISQRKKIFQSLYIQRQRLETLFKRFQEVERTYLDRIQSSDTTSSSPSYSQNRTHFPVLLAENWIDTNTLMDTESLKKSSQLIYEMAMNNGRNEIRPQQKPLHFPKLKQISGTNNKEKTLIMNQDQMSIASLSFHSVNNSNEQSFSQLQSSSLLANDSSAFSFSLKTSMEQQKEKMPSNRISLNDTPRQAPLDEHEQQPETTKIGYHLDAFKENPKEYVRSKSSSFQHVTNANSHLYQEKEVQQSHPSSELSLVKPDDALHKSSTSIQSMDSHSNEGPTAPLDGKSKDTKNEDTLTTPPMKSSNDQQHEEVTQLTIKTLESTEADNSNMATTDHSVMRDFESMEFSNEKQSESRTNPNSQKGALQMQNNPFGRGFPQVGTVAGPWSGFGSLASTDSTFSSPSSLTTVVNSSQQNVASNTGFSSGFGSPVSHPPMNSPLGTNVNTSSSGYQFGSPSPFLSPVAGAFGISNVTPPTNRAAFGFGMSSSDGSNPFASLAQRTATSPVLSSNIFGSVPNPSTSPGTNAAFTWSQSTSTATSLPPSFSQMRK